MVGGGGVATGWCSIVITTMMTQHTRLHQAVQPEKDANFSSPLFRMVRVMVTLLGDRDPDGDLDFDLGLGAGDRDPRWH